MEIRHLSGLQLVLVVGKGLVRAGGRARWVDGFPETLRCSAINFPTHSLKWWWRTIQHSVGGRRLSPCHQRWWFALFGNRLNNAWLIFGRFCLLFLVNYGRIPTWDGPSEQQRQGWLLSWRALGGIISSYASAALHINDLKWPFSFSELIAGKHKPCTSSSNSIFNQNQMNLSV